MITVFNVAPMVETATGQGVTEEWIVRYNGEGNGNDTAYAMTIDSAGYIYVTGQSRTNETRIDYATVKYDQDGNMLWIAKYNGPGDIFDRATAIATDSSGNVYVTGRSYAKVTYLDYATVAYDSNGNELWAARYNGPKNISDVAHDIAIDSSGNVYVTGRSYGIGGTSDDYATIKYDQYGNELWLVRYDGPEHSHDSAHAIAVDSSGNVYVTGMVWFGSKTGYDYYTIAYDTNGNELWNARYNGPESDSDFAIDMTIDSSSNIYVTGYGPGSGTSWDYATVKYDKYGNELWSARYNGPGNKQDRAWGIAVDSSGNVYVTGDSGGLKKISDYATVAYDSDGNELWVARYDGPDSGYDLAFDIASSLNPYRPILAQN